MQPQSPSPEYDFILKDNKSSRRGLPLPSLPKPVMIGVVAVIAIIFIAIIYSALSGRKNSNWAPYDGVLARGNETLRVTKLVSQQLTLQDPQTQSLAATVDVVFSSDQHQYLSYLSRNHVKVSAAQLAADTDKTTDTSLQSAAQNNSLDSAYKSYLKTVLTKYETDLENALNGSGPNGKKLLGDSIESTRALLNSAPLKS
jgi:hypothetical protein